MNLPRLDLNPGGLRRECLNLSNRHTEAIIEPVLVEQDRDRERLRSLIARSVLPPRLRCKALSQSERAALAHCLPASPEGSPDADAQQVWEAKVTKPSRQSSPIRFRHLARCRVPYSRIAKVSGREHLALFNRFTNPKRPV